MKEKNAKMQKLNRSFRPPHLSWGRRLQERETTHSLNAICFTFLPHLLAHQSPTATSSLRKCVVARSSPRVCSSALGSQSSTFGPGGGASNRGNSLVLRVNVREDLNVMRLDLPQHERGQMFTGGLAALAPAESCGPSRGAAAHRPWRCSHPSRLTNSPILMQLGKCLVNRSAGLTSPPTFRTCIAPSRTFS